MKIWLPVKTYKFQEGNKRELKTKIRNPSKPGPHIHEASSESKG